MCNKPNAVMKKHFFNVIAALSLVCGVFAFSGCTDFEKDINDLNERLEALETGKIADLEDQIASLQDALDAANGAIDALEAFDIQGLKDQLASLQATVDGIDLSKYVTVEDFEKLQDNLDALEDVVNGIDLDKYATLDYVNGTFATKDEIAALETALGALQGSLDSLQDKVAGLESAMASLGDRVEGLEGLFDVDTVKISEILGKIEAAQQDASEALGRIESLENAFNAYVEVGKAYCDSIETVLDGKLDKADFLDEFNKAFDKALDDALANGGEINAKIAEEINKAVEKINALFKGRLTSVSLIPTAYLDGVPAIKFNSYLYTIKSINPAQETVTPGDDFRISAKAVDVKYHISPSNVTKDDIQTPEYLIQQAEMITTRAAADIELNVIDYAIEDDILKATVRRNGAEISLNPENDSYIYTAALKVPIAKKNLVEGETEANVYSEYSALYEDEVTPYIAAVIDDSKEQKEYNCEKGEEWVNHFIGTYTEAATATSPIAKKSAYNKDIDLMAMVIGCEGDPESAEGHNVITKATLKENGLAFRFALPTKAFPAGENDADQQAFATVFQNISAGTAVLKSTAPGATAGVANQAAIGKTPVVRVELVDTVNNHIVDVRYFKVKWTAESIVPAEGEDFGILDEFNYVLGCTDFDEEIEWRTFVEKILSQLDYNGNAGIAYTDFVKVYKSENAEVEITFDSDKRDLVVDADRAADDEAYTIYWDDQATDYDRNAAAITWNIRPSEFGSLIDGKNVSDLKAGDVIDVVTMAVTLESSDDYNGDITFSIKVNILVPELPSLVGLNTLDWIADGELARIRPVQYGSETQIQNNLNYVTYNYDMTTLFRMNAQGVAMNNVLPVTGKDFACRAWSFQFARDQRTGYIPGFNYPGRTMNLYAAESEIVDPDGTFGYTEGAGYELYNVTDRAAYMIYDGEENAAENWHQDAHDDIALYLSGEPWAELGGDHYRGTDASIALLEGIFQDGTFEYDNEAANYEKRVTINAWGRINPWNHVIVKTFDVVFIKPLYIMQSDEEQFFEDGYMSGRYVDVEDLFTARDSWKYLVNVYEDKDAKTEEEISANELMKYYDVQAPKFSVKEARIGMADVNGNWVPMDNNNLTDAQIEALPLLSVYDVDLSVTEEDKDNDGVKELVFKAERGWNVEKVVYIYVEVSIEHKWGTESMWVHIPVYPHDQIPAQN